MFCCIFVSYTNVCPGEDGERGEGEEGRQDQGEAAEGRADGSVLRPKQERDLQVQRPREAVLYRREGLPR